MIRRLNHLLRYSFHILNQRCDTVLLFPIRAIKISLKLQVRDLVTLLVFRVGDVLVLYRIIGQMNKQVCNIVRIVHL